MIEENRNGRLQFYGSPEFGKIYRHKNNEYLLMIAECSQGKSFLLALAHAVKSHQLLSFSVQIKNHTKKEAV